MGTIKMQSSHNYGPMGSFIKGLDKQIFRDNLLPFLTCH